MKAHMYYNLQKRPRYTLTRTLSATTDALCRGSTKKTTNEPGYFSIGKRPFGVAVEADPQNLRPTPASRKDTPMLRFFFHRNLIRKLPFRRTYLPLSVVYRSPYLYIDTEKLSNQKYF